jgi:hypothetical protein
MKTVVAACATGPLTTEKRVRVSARAAAFATLLKIRGLMNICCLLLMGVIPYG